MRRRLAPFVSLAAAALTGPTCTRTGVLQAYSFLFYLPSLADIVVLQDPFFCFPWLHGNDKVSFTLVN